MKDFIYSYPTKVYFGEKAAAKALPMELPKVGKTVMLAYGGGSVKKSGVYDEVYGFLREAGKEVVDFPGIMPNPTYKKVQEGAALAREKGVDFILAVGGGSVIDCCKIIAAQTVTDRGWRSFIRCFTAIFIETAQSSLHGWQRRYGKFRQKEKPRKSLPWRG